MYKKAENNKRNFLVYRNFPLPYNSSFNRFFTTQYDGMLELGNVPIAIRILTKDWFTVSMLSLSRHYVDKLAIMSTSYGDVLIK